MATWAIGDVHGCDRSLAALLGRPEIAAAERLLFVGDLVNRGPRSLDVLRRVADLGERAAIVLGNHDLHLLARAEGAADERRSDRLEAVLEAPDRRALLAWLARGKLARREGAWLLVHAGLDPAWDAETACSRARRAESWLADAPGTRWARMREADDSLDDVDSAIRRDLRILTLMRVVDEAGRPAFDFTGPLAELPEGRRAWFDAPERRSRDVRVVCGHWAALGLLVRDDVVALDTGCAWGGALTAYRLDDGRIERTENLDR